LKKLKGSKFNPKLIFIGDGELREECEKFGRVTGFVDPEAYLKKALLCYAPGYLSALEALVHKSIVEVDWINPLQKDVWQMTPFYKYIKNKDIEGAYEWVKDQTWEKLTNDYLRLWKK